MSRIQITILWKVPRTFFVEHNLLLEMRLSVWQKYGAIGESEIILRANE